MARKVRSVKVRKSLGDIMDRAALKHEHFRIERNGKSLMSLLSPSRRQRVEMAIRQNLLRFFRSYSPMVSQEEADRLGLEAKRWARRPKGKKSGRF